MHQNFQLMKMILLHQHFQPAITGLNLLAPSPVKFLISHPRKLPKNFTCRAATASINSPSTFNIEYGPSLENGQKSTDLDTQHQFENDFLDTHYFSRSYEVAALRVPAEECNALENRLRGHLLNWPRLKNIARVSGDDIDDGFRTLLGLAEKEGRNSETGATNSVLQRAKMVETFNKNGHIRFPKLERLSRPKKNKEPDNGSGYFLRKKAKDLRNGKNKDLRNGKNKVESSNGNKIGDVGMIQQRIRRRDVLVEVLEEGAEMRGLLGQDFGVARFRGPTRLLLLDQRYARKPASELPQAVQVLLNGDGNPDKKLGLELIQCKLTLFYDYWQMNEVLEELLPKGMIIPSSFETVGHIAHLNLKNEHLPYRRLIAQVVFDKNRPRIQTVVNKTDAIQNDFRTMDLEVLAGNHSLVTCVVENGLRFHVDLAAVYWNSRLSGERQRLIDSFECDDNICDVFAGVGPVSVAAAKKVNRVYSNDLNPSAVKYQSKNIKSNKVQNKVEVYNMDGREFIKEILGRKEPLYITHVVMNLPTEAAEFLDALRGIFREVHKKITLPLPKIHVYGFSKAELPEAEFVERISMSLGETPTDARVHRVRVVAPGKWMLCATFTLPEEVAYSKQL